ncbi:MAG: hypothetical protein Q8P12_03170, partial [bacterium]|nr:hypothetical protein [bacterium]
GGCFHLLYFSAQAGVVLAVLWAWTQGALNLVEFLVFALGMGLYGLALWRDVTTRRWADTPPARG